eukprot:5227068-Alexandrium_andersonii.AAC.1
MQQGFHLPGFSAFQGFLTQLAGHELGFGEPRVAFAQRAGHEPDFCVFQDLVMQLACHGLGFA